MSKAGQIEQGGAKEVIEVFRTPAIRFSPESTHATRVAGLASVRVPVTTLNLVPL